MEVPTLQYILVRFNLNSSHPLCISMSFLAPKNGIMQINCSYYALVSSSTPFDCFNSLLSFIKSFFNLIQKTQNRLLCPFQLVQLSHFVSPKFCIELILDVTSRNYPACSVHKYQGDQCAVHCIGVRFQFRHGCSEG